MSATEIAVIAVGLLVGYWMVSSFSGPKNPDTPAKPADPEPTSAQAESQGATQSVPMDCHQVLGVPADATTEEVRAAYRRQISMYHPDKVAGLGEELQAVAVRKSQEIGAAYEKALKLRGAVV